MSVQRIIIKPKSSVPYFRDKQTDSSSLTPSRSRCKRNLPFIRNDLHSGFSPFFAVSKSSERAGAPQVNKLGVACHFFALSYGLQMVCYQKLLHSVPHRLPSGLTE